MGAQTINRKRPVDHFSESLIPQFDTHLSYTHISKKSKLSLLSPMSHQQNPDGISRLSIVSRISAYPDSKRAFSREPHAPVRSLRFKSLSFMNRFVVRTTDDEGMPVFHGIEERYVDSRKKAIESIRYFPKDDEVFVEREKVNEVIDIDDEMRDVSSIEEKDGFMDVENTPVEKGFRSLDSSVVSDVSNANGKDCSVEKADLMLLDSEDRSDLSLPAYKKLLSESIKRSGKLSSLQFEIEMNEKRSKGYQFLRSQTKKHIKKDLAEECFTPLTEEEQREVANALSPSNSKEVVASHKHSCIDITGKVLQCLKPGAWLNDEVINVYLELLKEREKREPKKFLKCHFFNTFFYKKLIGKGGYDFASVKRWTTQRKLGYSLFECEKIFVPIHQQIHWCLAIINKKEKKFQYLDSLRGVDSQVLRILAKYYVDEVKEKSGKDIDVSSWEVEYVKDLPEQENGFDCGMFMIKYADFYSRDLGLCFRQEHMPYFRKRTVKELLRLKAE